MEISASKSSIVILIIFIIIFVVLYRNPSVSYNLMDKNYDKGVVLTTNIKDYKNLFNQKINYVKQNSNTLLDPIDENILNLIGDKFKTSQNDIISAFVSTLMIPGNTIGYTPMTPFNDTSKKICFQLEQGSIGWYWLYGTFPKTKDCFLYMLTRVDLLPTELRQKLGYKLGETTVYCVTLGIGNGESYYYGNVYFEGSLIIKDNLNFSIISKDKNFSFTHSLDKMYVSCKNIILTNNNDENDKLSYNFISEIYNYYNMSLNQEDGCYPCEYINNSYQSYTNLYTNISYNNSKGLVKQLYDGYGWMDHEWGDGSIKNIFYKLSLPMLRKGKLYVGLPPYIWLNIRLSDNLQYMIFSFFDNPPKKGDSVQSFINIYKPSGVSFSNNNPKVTVKVLDTTQYKGVEYPTIYQVIIEGNTYILDSTKYGKTIFRDDTNNNHWGGSCDVLKDDIIVGTGFMEAQRFDSSIIYLKDTFSLLGFDESSDLSDKYNNSTYTSQLIFGYSLFLLFIILLIILVYRLVKYIINYIYSTQSKNNLTQSIHH